MSPPSPETVAETAPAGRSPAIKPSDDIIHACPTVVLGGGPAGLSTAYHLAKLGVAAHVLEAESTVGGACRTQVFAGLRYDLGAHRLHNVFPEVTREIRYLLGEDLVAVSAPSHIHHRGKTVPFPPGPVGLARALGWWRTARSTLAALARSPGPADNFRDAAIAKYGRLVAESFLINYSEKLWGVPAERLSVEVSGRRLQGLDVRTALRDLVGFTRGEHLDGAFLYPRAGFGQIADALAARVPHVHTRAKVERICHADNRLATVDLADGRRLAVRTVVSTLPLASFVQMLDPAAPDGILELAVSLRYRSRSASLYFPCADVPFTRIYEPKQRSSAMSSTNRTCLVLEHPVFPGDAIAALSRRDFLLLSRRALLATGLLTPEVLLDGTDETVRDAYPVLDVDAATRLQAVDAYLGRFTNLHRVGRAACFRYSHVHDLMHEGRLLAARLAGVPATIARAGEPRLAEPPG
jgi:protoporphyrinogen oxidase